MAPILVISLTLISVPCLVLLSGVLFRRFEKGPGIPEWDDARSNVFLITTWVVTFLAGVACLCAFTLTRLPLS